jgi:hypothetical protein
MTQTGGLDLLFAWLIFAGLLVVLAALVLRHHPDVMDEARRTTTDETPRSANARNSGPPQA